jgi:hypothetical protein
VFYNSGSEYDTNSKKKKNINNNNNKKQQKIAKENFENNLDNII